MRPPALARRLLWLSAMGAGGELGFRGDLDWQVGEEEGAEEPTLHPGKRSLARKLDRPDVAGVVAAKLAAVLGGIAAARSGPLARLRAAGSGEQRRDAAAVLATALARLDCDLADARRLGAELGGDLPGRIEAAAGERERLQQEAAPLLAAAAAAPAGPTKAGIAGPGHEVPHRAAMERAFGVSFAEVKAHTGDQAQAACAELDAAAYTMGAHVVFASPSPEPALVAHELAHVLQQRGGGSGTAGEAVLEAQADQMASVVAAGGSVAHRLGGLRSAAPEMVQRKPAVDAPAAKQSRRERLEEGRWKFAFVFTEGDYGKYAQIYLRKYYPNHQQFRAHSLENMFEILAREVAKLDKRRDDLLDEMYGDAFVEEIVVVSHGTAGGALQSVPLLDRGKRVFTPWDVAALQRECDEGKHERFLRQRKQAISAITSDTRIVVRGCELGESRDALVALRTLFGGEPAVFAPIHYQGFELHEIGGDLIKSRAQAVAFLVAGGYAPPELATVSEDEQRRYLETYFGEGLPAEFFITTKENHDALQSMKEAHEKDPSAPSPTGPEGEQYKMRPGDAGSGQAIEPDRNHPDWAYVDSQRPVDFTYDGKTAAELVALAEPLVNPYRPENGALLVRLHAAWERKQGAQVDDQGRIHVDPDKVIPHRPAVFETATLVQAGKDARRYPAGGIEPVDAFESDHLDFQVPDAEELAAAMDPTRSQQAASWQARPAAPRPAGPPDPERETRRLNKQLVADLLAGIDHAARRGLAALDAEDAGEAVAGALQAAERIENLLSITAMPGKAAARLRPFAGKARAAFGHTRGLATRLVAVNATAAAALGVWLERVEVELAHAGWKWKALDADEGRTAGKFTREAATRIGTGTLAMIRHRVRGVIGKQNAGAVTAVASAAADEITQADRELARSADTPERKQALVGEVLALGESLAALDQEAVALGVAMHASLESMRDAETRLRKAVGLSERAIWETSLPTLKAIIDVMWDMHEVREDGLVYHMGHPDTHKKNVPARHHALLDLWFTIPYDREPDGTPLSGEVRRARLEQAVAATAPLLNAIMQEGDPDTLGVFLDLYFRRVDEMWDRVARDTVGAAIGAAADAALAREERPIDQLAEVEQAHMAAREVARSARRAAAIAQRVAGSNVKLASEALDLAKEQAKNADVPESLAKQIAGARTLHDVLYHLEGFANSVQAVLDIADPELRRQRLEELTGKHGTVRQVTAGGDVLIHALWLAQGMTSVYGAAGYGLLRAAGHTDAATQLLGNSAKVLSKISTVLNVLGVVTGLLDVFFGETAQERLDGAVTATWSGLGLLGKFVPRLARFTGPLAAAIAITWETLTFIGEAAAGAMRGLIALGLNMAYETLKRAARAVHQLSMKLAVASQMDPMFASDPLLAEELRSRLDGIRWNLAREIRDLLDRAKARGGNSDPGTYRPLRERFAVMQDVALETDEDLLIASEEFLGIVLTCFEDYQVILDGAVEHRGR